MQTIRLLTGLGVGLLMLSACGDEAGQVRAHAVEQYVRYSIEAAAASKRCESAEEQIRSLEAVMLEPADHPDYPARKHYEVEQCGRAMELHDTATAWLLICGADCGPTGYQWWQVAGLYSDPFNH